MRLLFAIRRPYPPEQCGGAQWSVHALIAGMVERGHVCDGVVVNRAGYRQLVQRIAYRLSGRRWLGLTDEHNGHPVHRATSWHFPALLARRIEAFRPDLLLIDELDVLEMVGELRPDLPVIVRIPDVNFLEYPRHLPAGMAVRLFSASHFLSRRVREHYGVDCPVLHPMMDLSRVRGERRDPRWITMVNPIAGKGVDLVLRLAELLPAREFLLVEGWGLIPERRAELLAHIGRLSNVTLHPWTDDIRGIYARTLVQIAPSRWEEGFGRVALEAQANGVPVLASDRGGLPEAVGLGGRVLPVTAPAEEWAAALEGMLVPDEYRRLEQAARANVARPDFDARRTADRFAELAEQHVAAANEAAASRRLAPAHFQA